MRRRLLWASGIVVAAVVAILILVVVSRPGPQFKFLRGRQPVATHYGSTYFCFRGDFDEVLKAARPELEALGYRQGAIDYGMSRSVDFDFTDPALPDGSDGWRLVSIEEDHSINSRREEGHDKGWITVWVSGEATVLDSIREFLGL